MWTTLAHVARFGIVIVRTDPEQVKHKGMTMFVVDMHAPGVEVRPLVQATGEAEFNEVYFTDVRIPDGERLGDVGEGWRVSLTTLMNERVSIGGQVHPRGSGVIAVAVRHVWSKHARRGDAVARDELARFWIDAEVNRLTNIRASQTRARRARPGPEGSVGKLAMAGLNQRIMNFVDGPHGPGGDALSGRLHDGAADDRDGPLEPAEGVPPGAGQLDRGRHDQHHEEHPRRAGPRPARRAPGRQGPALERSAPKLTARPADPARVVPLATHLGRMFLV